MRHVELVHVERQVLADARAPAHVVVEQREDRRAAKRPVDVYALRLCGSGRGVPPACPAAHRPVNVDDNPPGACTGGPREKPDGMRSPYSSVSGPPSHCTTLHGASRCVQRRHVGVAQHVVKRVHVVGVAAAHPLGQPVDVRNPAARRRRRRAGAGLQTGRTLVRRLARTSAVVGIEPRLPRANVDRVVVVGNGCAPPLARVSTSGSFGFQAAPRSCTAGWCRGQMPVRASPDRCCAARRPSPGWRHPTPHRRPISFSCTSCGWARSQAAARVLRRFDFGRLLGWVANPGMVRSKSASSWLSVALWQRNCASSRMCSVHCLMLLMASRPASRCHRSVGCRNRWRSTAPRRPRRLGPQKDVRLRMRLPGAAAGLVHHVVDAATACGCHRSVACGSRQGTAAC